MGHAYICPRAPGYNDYYLYNIDRMIDEVNVNGLYFDYGQPTVYRCQGWNHGCGWYDNDKKPHDSIRIKASRELTKRIYVLLKQKRPEGLICYHNSGGICPPVHGFCDITWNGEQVERQVLNDGLNYYDALELEKCRVEQRHEPWGVPVCFLPQFLRSVQAWDPDRYGKYSEIGWQGLVKAFNEDPAAVKATWHLAGLLLVHDSMFSGDWGMWARLKDIVAIQQQLGWDDSVKFYGYFAPNAPFRKQSPSGSSVVVSAYSAPKGFLICALNNTNQSCDITIAVPEIIRQNPPAEIINGLTGEKIELSGKLLRLHTDSRSPQLILLKYSGPIPQL